MKGGLSDESDLFAAGEECASHVLVDGEFDFGVIFSRLFRLAFSNNEIRLIWAAGKLTPKLLEIQSTERHIKPKNRVNLLESMVHDGSLIIVTTHRLCNIHVRADIP